MIQEACHLGPKGQRGCGDASGHKAHLPYTPHPYTHTFPRIRSASCIQPHACSSILCGRQVSRHRLLLLPLASTHSLTSTRLNSSPYMHPVHARHPKGSPARCWLERTGCPWRKWLVSQQSGLVRPAKKQQPDAVHTLLTLKVQSSFYLPSAGPGLRVEWKSCPHPHPSLEGARQCHELIGHTSCKVVPVVIESFVQNLQGEVG